MVNDYNIEFFHVYAAKKDIDITEEQLRGVELTKQVIRDLDERGKSYTLSVLIDNYNGNVDRVNENSLYSKLDDLGVPPDYMVYEKQLVDVAEDLIDRIRDSYLKRDEPEKISFHTESNNVRLWSQGEENKSFKEKFLNGKVEENQDLSRRGQENISQTLARRDSYLTTTDITLKYIEDDSFRYTCPLLTACWHLARLGVKPYRDIIKDSNSNSQEPFYGNRLITILSSQFLKVEGTVMEIISLTSSDRIKRNKEKLEYYFY